MNIIQAHRKHRGFTLMELLVAMTITTIIVGVLVSITGSAIDTWNRSRSELRAARQAKAMVDVMANDFESFISRNTAGAEWLSATFETMSGGDPEASNSADLIFFTAATDRYEGEVGVVPYSEDGKMKGDLGGDVSCVGYKLQWKDPIGTGSPDDFGTFVLNRILIDPKETFEKMLGKTNEDTSLETVWSNNGYNALIEEDRYFLCENIYQFTVTFHIQAYHQVVPTDPAAPPEPPQSYTVPVSVGSQSGMTDSFRVLGQGLEIEEVAELSTLEGSNLTSDELQAGRLSAIEVSITVMSDSAINLLRKNNAMAGDSAWISKNTFNYSKLIQLPKL